MAFNEKETKIIQYGLANGKTKEEVTKAISNFRNGVKSAPVAEPKQTFLGGLKEDLNTRVDRVGAIQARPDSSMLEKGLQTFGQGAGLASNAVEKTVEQIPGVKQAFGAIGSGINFLATSDYSPAKKLGDQIGKSKTLQNVVGTYDTDPNFKDSVDAVANIARLGGNVQMGSDASRIGRNALNKATAKVTAVIPPGGGGGGVLGTIKEKAGNLVPKSEDIMNRVARLKPTDFNKFEKVAGKTPGQYLTETGNFGSPDKIITNESIKFTKSINAVNTELAKLPGTFKDGSIVDALTELSAKVQNVSGANVKAPYKGFVDEMISKYNQGGLTMNEVNGVKRLFEREVKLGYNKLVNGDKVAQATNIDNALRNWQFKQAETLGFNNIAELNKQTQISKFLINKLGDQVVGQAGLNSMGLTDWIMLSGGDPTAITGFLTKKFFSSKSVQAKLAEMLNKGDIKGQIDADIGVSKVKQIQAPQEGAPQSSNYVAPELPTRSLPDEAMTSKPIQPLPQGKVLKISSSNDTLLKSNVKTGGVDKLKKPNMQRGAIINPFARKPSVDLPNKQGGFVRLPTGKVIKAIDDPTKRELLEVKKYLREEPTSLKEIAYDRLIDKFEINTDQSISSMIKRIDTILDKTKTTSGERAVIKTALPKPKVNEAVSLPKNTTQLTAKEAVAKGVTEEQWMKGQGEPLYHGTNQDFNAFSNASRGNSTKMGSAKKGTFFTDSKTEAKSYADFADSNLVANEKAFNKEVNRLTKLQAEAERKAQTTRNPSDWKKSEDLTQQLEDFYLDETRDNVVKNAKVIEAYADLKNPMVYDFAGAGAKDSTSGGISELIKQARKNGNDGLIMKNIVDDPGKSGIPTTHTVVFDSKNIKTSSQLRTEYQEALKANKK